jgi:hypothetical protein
MKAVNYPALIDLEASGLHADSFPIQVAWAMPDGTLAEHLIRPEPDWQAWDDTAEALHGITPETLERDGEPAAVVAAALNHSLRGHMVFSDAPAYDRFWLDVLFAAAGREREFRLGDYWRLIAGTGLGRRPEALAELEARAWREVGAPRHQAGNDVRYLRILFRLASHL